MVEVVDLLSDSGEDEEIRPASSPVVILDDPSPPEPAPSSKGARAGSQSDASSSDLSDGGFRAAMASQPVVGMRSAAERILLSVGSRPPVPPRPASRRESDEGDAYFSDDSPVIAMSQRDRERLDKARERDRERARKAAEKEDERARKAAEKVAAKAEREAAKERAKADKAADKRAHELSSGKHRMRQITCVWDSRLGTTGKDVGYMLRSQLKTGIKDQNKVCECLNTAQMLPVARSVTWRYHPPSDEPMGFRQNDLTADATDGVPYTIAHVPGDEFVEMAWMDHVAARDAGYRRGEWDAPEPPGGFRRFIRAAKTALGRDHVLSLLVTNIDRACTTRERRDVRANRGEVGFSKAPVDMEVARIHARWYHNVRLTAAPDASTAVDHIVNMHRAWAMKPYVKPTTILDILGHNGARSTAAEQAALEAAFVAAKSVAPDGTAYESQELDSQFSQDTADVRDAAGHRRRTKTPAQVWAAALMKIPRVSEKEAMAIVLKYPTMMSLMVAYEDPSLSESDKRKLLKGLDCVGTHRGAQVRKLGEVISARVYEMFRPRDSDDEGDQVIAPLTE